MAKELSPDWLTPACLIDDPDYGDIIQTGEVKLREDMSDQLGSELTQRENMLYLFLLAQEGVFTSSKKIFTHLYGDPEITQTSKRDMYNLVSINITRIRARLGSNSIINISGVGYRTQRGYIISLVKANIK